MSTHATAGDDALDSFLDKWRGRWPEWNVAQVFVPASQRETALAWASLQQELTDAAWGGSDARPGEAKLAWWMEELQGWTRGIRRHPLGASLQRLPAPWGRLAAAIPSLQAGRERPRDPDEALAVVAPFSEAVVAIEAALFGVPETGVAVVQATVLHGHLLVAGEAAVPMSLLAKAGEGAPARAWGTELLHRWPIVPGASRPRRLWSALARQRLRRGDPALPLPPLAALMAAWRGVRG